MSDFYYFETTWEGEIMEKLIIESTAFSEGGMIPVKYTCDGENVSPPLKWNQPPEGTNCFALISDDPDAPAGTWVHWVVYNIPAHVRELHEDVPSSQILPDGTVQGMTDFRSIGYGGPCPPSGTHRYYFKLYALDIILNINPGATKRQLLHAMEGHILAQGEFIGRYARQR